MCFAVGSVESSLTYRPHVGSATGNTPEVDESNLIIAEPCADGREDDARPAVEARLTRSVDSNPAGSEEFASNESQESVRAMGHAADNKEQLQLE